MNDGNMNVNNLQPNSDEGMAPTGATANRRSVEPAGTDTTAPQGAAGTFGPAPDPFPNVENALETHAKMNGAGASGDAAEEAAEQD